MLLQGQHSFSIDKSLAAPLFRVLILLICGIAGAMSVAMGPDNNWDLRYYHLYAPWAYLHGRYLIDIDPAQAQSYFNPTADFLFYGLTFSPLNEFPRIVAFIMGSVHGINGALILAIAVHVLSPLRLVERSTLCGLALLMGISGAGFVSLLGTTTNDLLVSIFVLGSLLGILQLDERASGPGDSRGFFWSGVLAGVGLGLKYTAALFMPGLGLVALIAAIRRASVRGLVAFVVATMAAFLLVAGHHLLTLWHAFGNPVFPLLNDIFQSPYYEPQSVRDARFVAHDFGQLIGYPFYWLKTSSYLVSELAFRDWRGAFAYVAIVSVLLRRAAARLVDGPRRHERMGETRGFAFVVIFMVVSYFFWCAQSGIYRYAVVLEMLTGVVAIGGLIWLFKDSRSRIAVAIAVSTIAAATTIYPDWGRGEHPSAGVRPAQFADKYIDVRVPPLPEHSLVLIATADPVSYFIPFAEPTARYLGIENGFLELSQRNKLAAEVTRLMRKPGPAKFVVSVGESDGDRLNDLLAKYGLRLSSLPCQQIRSNLEEHRLSLCRVAGD